MFHSAVYGVAEEEVIVAEAEQTSAAKATPPGGGFTGHKDNSDKKQAWSGVLPEEQGQNRGIIFQIWDLVPVVADLCAGIAYERILLLWCLLVFTLGSMPLVLPMGVLARKAASYQIATEAARSEGHIVSMVEWSSTDIEKDSWGFWLFWAWCTVCRRLFTYGSFFCMALNWCGASWRAVLIWLPGFAAAFLTTAFELGFKFLASQSILPYTKPVKIADIGARYLIWFLCIVYCFAKSAPGQHRRTPTCSVVALVIVALTCYLFVTQVIQAYWSSTAQNKKALLFLCCAGVKLQRAVLTHVVIKISENLPNSTNRLVMNAGILLHATSNTGLHVLHFQSDDFSALILVQFAETLTEISTNLGYLLCQTELERWRHLGLRLFALLCGGRAPRRSTSEASGGDAEVQRLQAEAKQRYFANLVALGNISELTTLGSVTLLFMLCQQDRARLLTISGITLFGELSGDLITVVLGHLSYRRCGDAVPAILTGKEKLREAGFVPVSVLMACVAATLAGFFVTAMCPFPDNLGRLREIASCAAA